MAAHAAEPEQAEEPEDVDFSGEENVPDAWSGSAEGDEGAAPGASGEQGGAPEGGEPGGAPREPGPWEEGGASQDLKEEPVKQEGLQDEKQQDCQAAHERPKGQGKLRKEAKQARRAATEARLQELAKVGEEDTLQEGRRMAKRWREELAKAAPQPVDDSQLDTEGNSIPSWWRTTTRRQRPAAGFGPRTARAAAPAPHAPPAGGGVAHRPAAQHALVVHGHGGPGGGGLGPSNLGHGGYAERRRGAEPGYGLCWSQP
ncbi:unnamed protein product, partial [Prorocentrum cordatum]